MKPHRKLAREEAVRVAGIEKALSREMPDELKALPVFGEKGSGKTGIRTQDQLVKSQLLYQLSYLSVESLSPVRSR